MISCQNRGSANELNYEREKIIAVMADLYVVAEILQDVDPAMRDSLEAEYSAEIERIHGVEMGSIRSDIQTLQMDAEIYQELHDAVKDSLAALELRIKK